MYRSMSRADLAPIGRTSSRRPFAVIRTHPRPQVHVGRIRIGGVVTETGHALQSHPGVQEQADDRQVPPIAEVLA